MNPHFPLLGKSSNYVQDFEFELDFLNTSTLTKLMIPNFNFKQGTRFYGSFRNRGEGLNLSLESPGFSLGKYYFNKINLNALIREKDWTINLLGDKCIYDDSAIIENISLNQSGSYGASNYVLNWESFDSIKFEGDLKGLVNMDNTSLKVVLDIGQFLF